MHFATTWKNPLLPPRKKSLWYPSLLCADQGLSNFLHMSHYPPNISFRDTYLSWCNNTIAQIRQCFSVFTGPNDFGAGTRARVKNFRCMESEPGPEISVPLPQSCFRLLVYDTKYAFAQRNLFSCFSINSVFQDFVQVKASTSCEFSRHNIQII